MKGDRTDLKNGRFYHPVDYRPALDLLTSETAIKVVKDGFQDRLAEALDLQRVSAPLVVLSRTGLNDHLDGVQKPVCMDIRALGERGEIVQSLAKWKRAALADYGFERGTGLYTDMNAIRPDEDLDNFHSIYVDQWDWERVIGDEDRTIECLQDMVRRIYGAIRATEVDICGRWPELAPPCLAPDITFVHSQELEDRFPELTPREREHAICKEKGAVFVIGIGGELASGRAHDARAADYDDWITETADGRQGLNGDILVWYPVLNCAMELSSMGIRVNAESLRRQLEHHGEQRRLKQPFHQGVLDGSLPLTIGGGIGQSRLCMLLLRKAHVGEVQAAVWSEEMAAYCGDHGIRLL